MRIIAGSARGTKLLAPANVTRPTSDRVRESIFSMLQNILPDAHVLDLFAGTGALGIEALSRGAISCTFVENDHKALSIIQKNLISAKLSKQSRTISQDALKFLQTANSQFDLIVADPPYHKAGKTDFASPLLAEKLPLKENGFLMLEVEREREDPTDLPYLNLIKRRNYGTTSILLFEAIG